MKRIVILTVLVVVFCVTCVFAAQDKVVVGPFKLGVATSMPKKFWKPYESQFTEFIKYVLADPRLKVKLFGQSDGREYIKDSDAKNGGLAWDRLFALKRELLRLGLPESRIAEEDADHIAEQGDEYLIASVEVVKMPDYVERKELDNYPTRNEMKNYATKNDLANLATKKDLADLNDKVDKLALLLKKIRKGATVGIGVNYATNYFGSVPVTFTGSVGWKSIFAFEVELGMNPFHRDEYLAGQELDIRNRLVAGHLVVYLTRCKTLSIVGGWERSEEWTGSFDGHTEKFEGPAIGPRIRLWKIVSITGLYAPGYLSKTTDGINWQVSEHTDQFRISVGFNKIFGGGR